MEDGRAKNGGSRPGAGRKSKSLEDDLRKRLEKALKGEGNKSRLDEIFAQLVQDSLAAGFKTRHAARAMLFDRLYGKAKEKVEHTGEGGKDLMPTVNIIIESQSSTPSQTGTGALKPSE
jgi:hypothetical protein